MLLGGAVGSHQPDLAKTPTRAGGESRSRDEGDFDQYDGGGRGRGDDRIFLEHPALVEPLGPGLYIDIRQPAVVPAAVDHLEAGVVDDLLDRFPGAWLSVTDQLDQLVDVAFGEQ